MIYMTCKQDACKQRKLPSLQGELLKTRRGYFLTLDAIVSMLLLLGIFLLVYSLSYQSIRMASGTKHLASDMLTVIDKQYGATVLANTTGVRTVVESMPLCASVTLYNSSLSLIYAYPKQGCSSILAEVDVAYRSIVNDTGTRLVPYLLEGKVWSG